MARVCFHESIVMNGKRVPADGTKGNVFVIEEFISREIKEVILWLCAVRIGWKNLKVSVKDIKFASGTFEFVDGHPVIKLDKYEDGWYPYRHREVQEQLIDNKVVLL